jgi:hypothetical protein
MSGAGASSLDAAHQPRVRKDSRGIVVRIVALAREYGRCGYRRLTAPDPERRFQKAGGDCSLRQPGGLPIGLTSAWRHER